MNFVSLVCLNLNSFFDFSYIFVVVDSYNRWSFMDFSIVDVFFVPPSKLQCIFLQIFRFPFLPGVRGLPSGWRWRLSCHHTWPRTRGAFGVCRLSCDLPCLWQNFLVFNKHLSGVHAESQKRFILRLQVWENTCRWDHNHWHGSHSLFSTPPKTKMSSENQWLVHMYFLLN